MPHPPVLGGSQLDSVCQMRGIPSPCRQPEPLAGNSHAIFKLASKTTLGGVPIHGPRECERVLLVRPGKSTHLSLCID